MRLNKRISTLLTEDDLVQGLREVLKSKRVSLRDISKDLGVPYRSVQNYVGGETRMPASFFLNLCVYIGLEPDFIATKDFRPREEDLYDAVWTALHRVKLLDELPPSDGLGGAKGARAERLALVRKTTVIIAEQYDRYRREWLKKTYGWGWPQRPPTPLPPEPEVDR